MDHFHQFFAAICAGLGLFLAGVGNLLLLRKSFVLRASATALAFGVALAAAVVIEQPNIVANTARLLAFGFVPIVVLGNRRLVSSAAALVAATGRPTVRYALLTAAGIGVAIGSIVVCEREDDRINADSMTELDLIESRVPSIPVEREKAATDRGTLIVLREPVNTRDSQTISDAEERFFRNAQLKEQVIRQSAADERTNCHGWVFTGGKFILSGVDVDLILKDNDYTEQEAPLPGDLVIYRANKAVIHTAIVQYVSEGQPVLARSKWGSLGVFIHPIDKSPYGTNYAYYRSPRAGHVLAAPPGPSNAAPSMATE